MTTPPLSPAAQAVFDAFVAEAGPGHRHQREAIAAAIRALVEQTLPAEKFAYALQQTQRQHTRTQQLAIAAELDGGVGAPVEVL
jgi:hypothetical protein